MSLNTSADMEKDITVTSDVVDRFLQSKSNFQGKYFEIGPMAPFFTLLCRIEILAIPNASFVHVNFFYGISFCKRGYNSEKRG